MLLSLFYISSAFCIEYLSEESEYLDVYFEKLADGGYSFYGNNRHFIPQFVNLGFVKLSNLQMDRANPSKVVLAPGDEGVLLCTLAPIEANKSYSFRSQLSFSNGDPFNVSPQDYIYLFFRFWGI